MKKVKTLVISTALSMGLFGGIEATSAEKLEMADMVEDEYARKFGCAAVDVVFRAETKNIGSVYREDIAVAANSPEPSEVSVYPVAFDRLEHEAFEEMLAHEMTHACAGPVRTFERPWVTVHGDRLTGNQGFVILAENPKKQGELRFTLIEEGAATVLEKQIIGQTSKEHAFVGYVALKELTEELQARHGISNEQLAKMVQTSDLLGFVAIVSEKPSADRVTLRDLSWVMRMYYDAFEPAIR